MKKNLLIAIIMVGAMFEASAMISPKERAVPSRQGFRYSKRSILVNKYGRLVIPKQHLKNSNASFFDEEGNLVLDEWFERNDLPSNFFGGRPYGGEDRETGQREYDNMIDDLKKASADEDKINKLRKLSRNEFISWKNDLNGSLGIYHYLRDMRITEKIFGMRQKKVEEQKNIYNAFLAPLNEAYNHQSSELRIALNNVERELENVKEQLENNPDNKILIDQKQRLADHKKVVEVEIASFKNEKNRDSFYQSSMSGKNFRLFQECRASQPQDRTRE